MSTRRMIRLAMIMAAALLLTLAFCYEHARTDGSGAAYAVTYKLEKTGSGTRYYASFPSGYKQDSSIYKKYNKERLLSYEDFWTKRVVSTSRTSYIYWHWTWRTGKTDNGRYNFYIHQNSSGDESHASYPYFADFTSAKSYGETDPQGNRDKTPGLCFYHWRNKPGDGSWWWFRLPLYKQTYADYKKVAVPEPADANVPECRTKTRRIRKITFSWLRPNLDFTGYQIEYSTSPEFKNSVRIKLKGADNCKYTIRKLKPGKVYYIRIRIYIAAGGKTQYKGWSKVIKARTFTKKGNMARLKCKKIKKRVYTGKRIKCKPVIKDGGVTLKAGRDYVLSYKRNVRIGTAVIIIRGRGRYFGTIRKKFRIIPRGIKIRKCRVGRRSVTVRWRSRRKRCSGYQIRYSTRRDFRNCKRRTIKGRKKNRGVIRKLKPDTVYFIEIRIYVTVHGRKYWSKWSKIRRVRTSELPYRFPYGLAYTTTGGGGPQWNKIMRAAPEDKRTKIGKRWFGNDRKGIFYSSGRTSRKKYIVKADYASGCLTDGNTVFYQITDYVNEYTDIYMYRISGKTRRYIDSFDSGTWISAYYKKRLYLSQRKERWYEGCSMTCDVLKYNLKTSSYTTYKRNCMIQNQRGRYLLASRHDLDMGLNVNEILDLKTGRFRKLCKRGYAIFTKKRVYYWNWNTDSLYKCTYKAKKKKRIRTVRNSGPVWMASNKLGLYANDDKVYVLYYKNGKLKKL